jgi:hypothetical protein
MVVKPALLVTADAGPGLVRTVLGEDPPGDGAVADVATRPEGDPLPAVEEFGCLVIDHRDRHLGVVARVQRLFGAPGPSARECGSGNAARAAAMIAREARNASARGSSAMSARNLICLNSITCQGADECDRCISYNDVSERRISSLAAASHNTRCRRGDGEYRGSRGCLRHYEWSG